MSTAAPTAPAARSSRRSQATNPPNGSSQGNPAHGERWYINDPAAKRVDTSGNPQLAAQIKELESSSLPAPVKNSAITGLRQQLAAARPLTLCVARAQKSGARDLIEISGDFKTKLLSPSLVAALASKPEFVRQFLGEFHASDE